MATQSGCKQILADGTYSLQMCMADEAAGANSTGLFLVEVPPAILSAVLEGGPDALEMRGPSSTSPAVMTVKGMPDKAYELKACETSNTVLVGPPPPQQPAAVSEQSLSTHVFPELVELVPVSTAKAAK